jgi:proline iminopeptidase
MYAKIRGTEIYFDVAGMQIRPEKNKFVEYPVLFLLHGGPGGDHSRFKIHSAALQDVAQLVFIDHRGSGRSKKTKMAHYTLDNNIEDIEALRKHLGLNKISILGGSYGGIVAQGYALRYPQHLDKLILVVTSPSYRFINRAKKNLHERGTPKQIKYGEAMWNGTFNTSKKLADFFHVMEPLYSVKVKKGKQKNIYQTGIDFSAEPFNKGFTGFLKTFDFIPQLKRIKTPTLVLGGDKDWICDPAESRTIAKNIPGAKLKIFKNCGHAIGNDAGKEYIKTVKAFLRTKAAKKVTRPKKK